MLISYTYNAMSLLPTLLLLLRSDYIPLRLRKKIGKLAGHPPAGMPFQVKVFGALFEGQTGNHQDDKIYTYGSHEAATLRLMRSILEHQRQNGVEPVYLDIGTNVGQHLVAVAAKARYAYGFEPWDKVRDRALNNLALNDFAHVQVLPYGLSDQDAKLPYFPPAGGNLGVGSFAADQGAAPITLEVRKGDPVIASLGIKPTLLKIDTEGFESYVLRGLTQTLAAHRPAVVFELGDESRKDFGSLEALQAFFPEGYSFHGILRSRECPKLVPFRAGKKYENLLAWPEADLPF